MKPVTRRTVMAGAAAVAVVPVVGKASASEDAKLVRLWEEWKAEQIRQKELYSVYSAAEDTAYGGLPPRWKLDDFWPNPSRAVFVCGERGLIKVVPLKAATDYDAIRDEARKIEARMKANYNRAHDAADRKHGVTTKEKAADRSSSRCDDLEKQIAKTPARGFVGVAIKLAVAKHNEDFLSEPCDALVLSAYKTLIKVTGLPDYAAQVKTMVS